MASHWSEPAGARRHPGFPSRLDTLPLRDQDLAAARRWLIVTGALSFLAGVVALAVPAVASVATSILVGWVLVFTGIVMAGHAFSRYHSVTQRSLRMLNALVSLVVGVYVLAFPLSGTITLTFALAVWFFAIGAFELLAAIEGRARGPATLFVALGGIVSMALGALIVADLPSSAGWAIGLLVGINLMFWGVRAVTVARLLKRVFEA